MKKTIVLIILGIFLMSPAHAGDAPYLTTALCRTFQEKSSYPSKEVEVSVKIMTNTNIGNENKKESVLYGLKYHEMLYRAFERQGWTYCPLINDKVDVGSLEITFEPRMKTIVLKTFVYPCDESKLWNMFKYRGGSHVKYFDQAVNKAVECIKQKHDFR